MPIRFMSAEEAAAYCGMGLEQFTMLVQPSIVSISIPSLAADTVPATRYDRHDIDAWCDGFKAAQSTKKPQNNTRPHCPPKTPQGSAAW
jgi:hypothetical protein